MPFPRQKSPYLKRLSPGADYDVGVHAVEVDPPKDVEPVEWILLTSLPVDSFDDAWRIWGITRRGGSSKNVTKR